MIFIDIENAYDRVSMRYCEGFWKKIVIQKTYIKPTENEYEKNVSGEMENFIVKVVIHQESETILFHLQFSTTFVHICAHMKLQCSMHMKLYCS